MQKEASGHEALKCCPKSQTSDNGVTRIENLLTFMMYQP